jgi:hypothetical protein
MYVDIYICVLEYAYKMDIYKFIDEFIYLYNVIRYLTEFGSGFRIGLICWVLFDFLASLILSAVVMFLALVVF